ncbi:MAG: hypothetical protein C5B53_03440, partial [Candidatus Melainabacteria bacterium]
MLNKPSFLIGVFLISFANLLFELLLVRIASVTLAPQTAFVVISVVMCGMTIGALLVFLLPGLIRNERADLWISASALLFAITEFAATLIHLHTKFATNYYQIGFLQFSLAYTTLLLPFVLSGICICLALARFPQYLAKTYAADLCGAAFACLALPALLTVFDGVSACIFVACLSALSGLAFAIGKSKRLVASSLILATLFFSLSLFNLQSHTMKIEWRVGVKEGPVDFESWNSYSRLIQKPPHKGAPFFWSKSSSAPNFYTEEIYLLIDSVAGTMMPFYDGNLEKVGFLKFDATNAGYYLRDNANVLVIGVGGGRDILSALVFGARAVTGVEINQSIINLLTGRCSLFNQIARNPRVHLVNEDGRTFMIRTEQKFDFIQISLVDTFAATVSGAMSFSENSIYTVEAWRLALERLSDRGIFSFSYWHSEKIPFFHRFVYTAAAALRSQNIDNPTRHMILLQNKGNVDHVRTLLVCRSPFSKQDIDKIREVANRLHYKIIFDPEQVDSSDEAQMLSEFDPTKEPKYYHLAPATDDRPFPFSFTPFPWEQIFVHPEGIPLVVSLVFAVCGILLPLALTKRNFSFVRAIPL